MNGANRIPDESVISDLLLGRLAPEDSELLCESLIRCDGFPEAADRLTRDDDFVDRLRRQAGCDDGSPRLDRFIDRVLLSTVGCLESSCDADTGSTVEFPTHPHVPQRLGAYRLVKLIGVGGMGSVYLAEDTELHREVALKVMHTGAAADKDQSDRFMREARAAAQLNSDFIVPIYHVGCHEETPFLAMSLLSGQPLDQRLLEDSALSIPEILRIGRDVALGLEAAHRKGLVHRDIKPANLWLEQVPSNAVPWQRVRILDFGIARPVGPTTDQLTVAGQVLGTPAYMAPEQAAGNDLDHRADLFSLGCVLYELTTGCQPFAGPTTFATLSRLAGHRPASPSAVNSSVPPPLSRLILRLLEKDPEDRPDSAAEVAKELDLLASDPKQSRRAGRRSVGMMLAATACLLLLLSLAVVSVKTPKGTLVLESDDPNVEIIVKKDGALIVDKTGDRQIPLRVGDYAIEVLDKRSGLTLETQDFTIRRGKKTLLRAHLRQTAKQAAVLASDSSGALAVPTGAEDWAHEPEILFGGLGLDQWRSAVGGPASWDVREGYVEVAPGAGDIRTVQEYKDFHLHLEFWIPEDGGAAAESGVFLQGRHEIEIRIAAPDAQARDACGAMRGLIGPRQPLESTAGRWQTYDIYYRSPTSDPDGRVTDPGRLTLLHDGRLAINGEPFSNPTQGGVGRSGNPGPIVLRDQGARIRFRKIRVTPLVRDKFPTRQFVAPLDHNWVERVRELGPQELVEIAQAALTARNPLSECSIDTVLSEGVIGQVTIGCPDGKSARDLSPLQCFRHLRNLRLKACDTFEPRMLGDLSGVTDLTMSYSKLDPRGLKDQPEIRTLRLITVSLVGPDPYSHLRDLPLKHVEFNLTGPLGNSCLTAFTGQSLSSLRLDRMRVSDLSLLKEQDISTLSLADVPVADIGPVVTPSLTKLELIRTAVNDLTHLKKATSLQSLALSGNPVNDLKPLEGLPLRQLDLKQATCPCAEFV